MTILHVTSFDLPKPYSIISKRAKFGTHSLSRLSFTAKALKVKLIKEQENHIIKIQDMSK